MYLGVGSSPINCTKEELLQIATALFIFRKMLRLILVLHHGKQPVSYAVHSGIVNAEIHPAVAPGGGADGIAAHRLMKGAVPKQRLLGIDAVDYAVLTAVKPDISLLGNPDGVLKERIEIAFVRSRVRVKAVKGSGECSTELIHALLGVLPVGHAERAAERGIHGSNPCRALVRE